MVRWVNAQDLGSPIGDAIKKFGAAMFGDTVTPAIKQEQLAKARRENDGAVAFGDNIRAWADAAANFTPSPAPVPSAVSPAVTTGGVATPASWLRYSNEGKIRNKPLSNELISALGFLGDMGIEMEVFSGGQDAIGTGDRRTGSTRHDNGNAADVFFYKDGRRLDWRNAADIPIYQEIVRRGRQAGLTGFGAGPGYMPPGSMHIGFGDAAVWGADGRGVNAPEWLQEAYSASEAFGATPSGSLPAPAPSPMTGAPDTRDGRYNPNNAAQMIGEMMANGVASGMTPDQIGDAARVLSSMMYGATNEATVNAQVASGQPFSSTYAGFAADQNRRLTESREGDAVTIRGQDIASADRRYADENEIIEVVRDGVPVSVRKSDLQPNDQAVITNAEQQALTARGADLTPEQELAYIGAEPKNVQQADRYVAPDGAVIPSIDGLTDARTGAPLPDGSLKTSVLSPDRASSGALDPTNARNVEAQVIGLNQFKGDIAAAREIAVDPTLFGLVGQARRMGQNLAQQFQQFSQTMPQQAQAIQAANNSMLAEISSVPPEQDPQGLIDRFFQQEYDPSLSAIEVYAQLLPYSAASAIAQQTGRGLSDQDVKRFQRVVGDPTSLWSTQQGFLAKLDAVEAIVDRRIAGASAVLSGGADASVPAPAATPNAQPTAPAQTPTPETIATMSMDDLSALQDMEIPPDMPEEAVNALLDAIAKRMIELQP